ncbi:hypothetical protein [Rhodopseudomonas palustris]|uniref:hypothetical protein n=1 Tax=Rhodopseudomonas palustris TaxID=1076 RepID=UPI0010579D79|nr:hypothetical protein [Rhodopseudomonas palustris]
MTNPWTTTLFAGALIASSLSAAPALARGQQDQRNASETASSSGCTSYERAPDGSWRPIPCVSAGPAAAITRSSAARNAEASN